MTTTKSAESIRAYYETHGVIQYYQTHGGNYSNPHESAIFKCLDVVFNKHKPCLDNVLDLACGNGVITSYLLATSNVVGIDPYTAVAYQNRVGKKALNYTFQKIGRGEIRDHKYDLIICSFALHLVEYSYLPSICYELAQISPKLLILTPHKRPIIRWGWDLIDELVVDRVRARYYQAAI